MIRKGEFKLAKYKVFVTDQRQPSFEIERHILEECDAELILCNCKTSDDIIRECALEADAVLLDLAPMDGKAVRALKKCKVINRYGVGVDNVDIKAATECGIQVTNVPDYCMEDVSDHAVAMMLACMRNIAMRDRLVRSGHWNIQAPSYRLKDKTLGVVGAGRIARALIRKVSGFGFKEVVAYDPFISAENLKEIGVRKVEFDELLSVSDIISLHLNLTDETRGIMNAEAISKMKDTALLVNVSRGGLIDDYALIDALKNHKIMGAGLDTHCIEPVPMNSEYMKLDSVILTDHAAYNTVEGVTELKTKAAKNILAVLQGQTPAYPVNKL
ncbi:Glyoxylate/hydroxypyruvate reductase B [bioreactor metagenome]|uniref:Glyoxylate/hydroxypyruvate reductase B n=1 Tax=bioreactor metagenome TaxID=1076179 RepID=A0A645AHE2_9ZZZZ